MAAGDRPDVADAAITCPSCGPGAQPPHPSWLPRQRRGTTPQMIGRYPDFDVLDAVDTWDEATQEGRVGPAGAARPAAVLHRRGGADAARVLRRRAGPGRRAAGAGGRDGRREAGRRAARRLPVRRHAATTATPGGSCWRGLDHTARAALPAPRSPAAPHEHAGEHRRASSPKGRLVGGPWDELNVARAWSVVHARRAGRSSTPTRGRGTRSASAARPTRGGSCGWAGGDARPGAVREAGRASTGQDPVRGRDEDALMGTFWRGLLKGAVGPRDNDSRYLLDVHRRDLPGEATMRRYADDDEVDLVHRRGRARAARCSPSGWPGRGWRVVVLEAGPFWHPDEDWVSDEAGCTHLYWTQKRIIGGADPIELGKNNSGRGVGGSMVHYAGLHAAVPPVATSPPSADDGVGADWPISYADLRPHYERVERELPVAGQDWPWGDPHRYPLLAAPGLRGGREAARGRAGAAGSRCGSGPVGIVNGTFGNRPHCIYRGYCLQGCKVNAKASPYVTHLPDALAHGVEIRANCMALRVEIDDATGARARRGLRPRGRRAASGCSAPGSWRSPATRSRPRGCCWPPPAGASRTGWATTTTRSAATSWCRAPPRPRAGGPRSCGCTRRPPPEISSEQFYETDPAAGSPAGSPSRRSRRCRSAGPSTCSPTATGDGRCASTCATTTTGPRIGVLNELLPHPDNRVTLADETDPYGQPVARMDYTLTRQRQGQHGLLHEGHHRHPATPPARRTC